MLDSIAVLPVGSLGNRRVFRLCHVPTGGGVKNWGIVSQPRTMGRGAGRYKPVMRPVVVRVGDAHRFVPNAECKPDTAHNEARIGNPHYPVGADGTQPLRWDGDFRYCYWHFVSPFAVVSGSGSPNRRVAASTSLWDIPRWSAALSGSV